MPLSVDKLDYKNTASRELFSLVDATSVKGGMRAVQDVAARNAIPAAHRVEGMVAYLKTEGRFDKLMADLTTWDEGTLGGGTVEYEEIRLSDHLSLDGSNEYTAFAALVTQSHTTRKKIIFDGPLTADFSAGAITLGGNQTWTVERDDGTQGLFPTGVVTNGALGSIITGGALTLDNFHIDASAVPDTNRTVLPAGATLFLAAHRMTISGEFIGTLNADTVNVGTGTGLSLAKAFNNADFDNLRFHDFNARDWWRLWTSDNGDAGHRDMYSFERGRVFNIGKSPFVVNMPGASGASRNTSVIYRDLQFEDWAIDADGTVAAGASHCKHVLFNNIHFAGAGNVGISFEEMAYAICDGVTGEVDHSRTPDRVNALIHAKANSVSTGSGIPNAHVRITNIDVKQIGDISSSTTRSYGLLLTPLSPADSALEPGVIETFRFEGFKVGIDDQTTNTSHNQFIMRNGTIDGGSVSGGGIIGVRANQIPSDSTNITIIGCQVGVRADEHSMCVGWTFEDCVDPVVGGAAGHTFVSGAKYRYTNQTLPGSGSLVKKFLACDLSGASTVAAIAASFSVVARSRANNAFSSADYDMALSNAGGIVDTTFSQYGANINGLAVVDAGGGEVQIFSGSHGLQVGDDIYIEGTTNYDGVHQVTAIPTAGTFQINATYVAETPSGATWRERTFYPGDGDLGLTYGSSDQLIVTRSGVTTAGFALGPGDEAINRGIHRDDTDETTPLTNGCLALKVENVSATVASDAVIEIVQTRGKVIVAAGSSIADIPTIPE